MSEQLTRKRRVRAGHKASVSRIMTQVMETRKAEEMNIPALKRQMTTLEEKKEIIVKLDEEILQLTLDEEELTEEIVKADEFKEHIELTILEIEGLLSQDQKQQVTATNGNSPLPTSVEIPPQRTASQNSSASQREVGEQQQQHTVNSPHIQQAEQNRASGGRVKLPKLTLMKFDGEITSWAPFWDAYESSVHNNSELSDVEKFVYLRSLLEDSAVHAISGLTLTSANYNAAVELLKKRFGNKQLLINKHMESLLDMEQVSSVRDVKGLRHSFDKIESHVRSLSSLGVISAAYGSLLVPVLMKRIPQEIALTVSREVKEDKWNFDDLLKIIEREIEARERTTLDASVTTARRTNREHATVTALLTDNSVSALCCFCNKPHTSQECRTVSTIEQRKQCLLRSGRCFICLKRGHLGKDCRSSQNCVNCQGRHHVSICPSPSSNDVSSSASNSSSQQTAQSASTNVRSTSSQATLSMHISTHTPVLLQTAVTHIYAPGKPYLSFSTRLLFDSGSQRSYISRRLRELLSLNAEKTEVMKINTFGKDNGKMESCDVVRVNMKMRYGPDMEFSLLTVPVICEPLTGQTITFATHQFKHLSTLDLADPGDIHNSADINILIGADNYWHLVNGRIQKGRGGPTAIETKLGWVLSGPVPSFPQSVDTTVNLCSSHVLKVDTQSSVADSNEIIEQELKKFWDVETLGIRDTEPSLYEQFLKQITFKDSRYCVRLPWKEPHPILPDNYNLCQTRLSGLLRRLKQNPSLLREYDAVIRDQLAKGIVEVVNSDLSPQTDIHYIPHHAVVREDKLTTKLRIVYDASARMNGPSLNDCLYAGPTFGQKILDILIRFRVHNVALVADIEKAFLMISVDEKDRDALRFLWVDSIDSEIPRRQVLRFARVVFGVSSSPFLLNATIKYHMDKYRHSDESFVDKFLRSIYVDDVSFGANTVEAGFELYLKSKGYLREGGFNLRKFVSNDPVLQQRIYEQEHENSNQTTSENLLVIIAENESYTKNVFGHGTSEGSNSLKVLGVQWNYKEDKIICDIEHICKLARDLEPTKRNVVGLATRFYDPFGLLSPVTVQFKILFQELCAHKLSWDERLTGELFIKWKELLKGFQQTQPLSIPRSFLYCVDKALHCCLMGFCDASKVAYAAVVYLRVETPTGCKVSFMASKTRVSPTSGYTIPRLELLASLLLSRLMSSLTTSLKDDLKLSPPMCFTDSKVTLYWITQQDKEWKQFVKNSV